MTSTTITSSESIQAQRCYLLTQTPSRIYTDFYADKQLLDFTGYERENPFYNDENKKVIGRMKDELNGKIIEEFVSLRAKMYSLKTNKK